MSAMLIQRYSCDTCGLRREITFIPRVYQIAMTKQVLIEQRHDWCAKCADISPFECVEDSPGFAEAVNEALEEWRGKRARYGALSHDQIEALPRHEKWEAESAEETIAEFLIKRHNWEKWRLVRTRPSKCLRCQLPTSKLPADDFRDLLHSDCGGVLKCSAHLSGVVGPEYYPHVYSVEGELVHQGRKPRIGPGLQVTYEPMELFVPKDWRAPPGFRPPTPEEPPPAA